LYTAQKLEYVASLVNSNKALHFSCDSILNFGIELHECFVILENSQDEFLVAILLKQVTINKFRID